MFENLGTGESILDEVPLFLFIRRILSSWQFYLGGYALVY